MMFKTACASFTAVELEQFSTILEGLSHQDFHYDVMGTAKAIVKNPYVCMGFCLSQQEANAMLTAVNESLTLFEAFNDNDLREIVFIILECDEFRWQGL